MTLNESVHCSVSKIVASKILILKAAMVKPLCVKKCKIETFGYADPRVVSWKVAMGNTESVSRKRKNEILFGYVDPKIVSWKVGVGGKQQRWEMQKQEMGGSLRDAVGPPWPLRCSRLILYLSKYQMVFVKIAKCISSNFPTLTRSAVISFCEGNWLHSRCWQMQ